MQKLKFEYRITAAYLIVGGLWIIFSDSLLNYFIHDPDLITHFQTFKGWFYVIVTGLLLYLVLKNHLERIREAEHKAKESDRLKTAFLQNISHEIRTPMNAIIGYVELLKAEDLTTTQKTQYLETISQSSNQLLDIVNEVLDISLIETGNLRVTKREIDLNDLLDDIYLLFKPSIKQEITFSLKKGLPDEMSLILTDEIKIRQILNNLINNAIKFTDKGHIGYGYELKNNELEFFIEDTGIGIEPSFQEKVFERFRKAATGNSRLYDGVGLGLAICKGNVEILNGRIWIKSETARGSTLYFTIPYEPVTKVQSDKLQ